MARFLSFGQSEQHHHEIMQDCLKDHWHILNLGVAPSVGRCLLEQAIHLAGQKPLFLECHNENVSYYEKFGFQRKKNYDFQTPRDESKSTFSFNAMRRNPQ